MSHSSGYAYDAAEPIAVIGMAMRFPGGSNSGEQFWDLLSRGRSAHAEIPKERFNAAGYYHPDGARVGAINIKGSYFLNEDPTLFDAPFFSMTANEANGTDPQQLLMLEVAYESLENAGIPINTVAGSATGVYVGCFTKDIESVGGRDPYSGPFYAATGNGQSMLSNRVSWFFDLRGPSMTIDTACSSSLYAVHLACQSLKLGESKLALVGGTNLIYDCNYMRDMCTMTFFSPDGVCHSFDHRANGYARGDGIGGIVLKTLKQALADGDTVRGVIRNSGLNQDGKTMGITMPSPQAQADLIWTTYAAAGLSLDRTAYFEAHGTGTAIGDPGEASAIGLTFGKDRAPENPIWLGTVKTNIGHLEGCAGLAGLIKTVLVVEKGEIPPLAGFEKVNPRLKLDLWRIVLPTQLTPWPTEGLRRASVNSFGYGGANAHVIVDDAYHYLLEHGLKGNHQTRVVQFDSDGDSGFSSSLTDNDEMELSRAGNKLFVFSASDQAGLQRLLSAYSGFVNDKLAEKDLESGESIHWPSFMSDLAFTLASRRSKLDHRSVVVAKSASDLQKRLHDGLTKLRRVAKTNNIIFIFTGQGAQWPSMGKELIKQQAFHESLQKSQIALEALGCTWSLVEEMFASKEKSRIDSPEFSQPLCTALQLALVDLLRTWDLEPKAVIGHSSGEIGAAYAAGLITHNNAVKVAYLRGIFSADVNRRQPGVRGAMMAVGLSQEAAKPYLARISPETVGVACINAPSSITLSGDKDAIEVLEKILKEDNVFVRQLRVQTAYHSHHMKVIAEDYLHAMGGLEHPKPAATGVTMFSSVTVTPITAQDLDATYWVRNMLSTVRFSEAVEALITQSSSGKGRRKAAMNYSAMIECGPSDALKGPVNQILAAIDEKLVTSAPYVSVLSRNVDAEVAAISAAGKLWAQGLKVNLSKINGSSTSTSQRSLANLPTYPWNHSRSYFHESVWGQNYRHREKPRTDLLGMKLNNQDPTEPRWHNFIRIYEQPWLADHKVQQMVLYPGAAMITMAIEAAREVIDQERTFNAIEARDIQFQRGLVIPSGDGAVETAIHLRPVADLSAEATTYGFKVFSRADGGTWLQNCCGLVAILYRGDGDEVESASVAWQSNVKTFSDIRKRATRKIAPRTFYKLFDRKMNLQYGPLHQNVTECVAGTGEGYGVVVIPDTRAAMPAEFEYPHLIHPSTLDSVFHMQALGYLHSLSGEESLVPISIASIYVSADVATTPGSQLKGYSKGTQSDSGESIGDIVLSDEQWLSPKVIVKGFLSKDLSVTEPSSEAPDSRPRKCTSIQWVELDEGEVPMSDAKDSDNKSAPTTAPEIELAEILLLRNTEASADMILLEEKLASELRGRSCEVRIVLLSDCEQKCTLDVAGKTTISLLEAEEPVIAKWTSEGLERFRKLATQAAAMLWVTRGGDSTTEKDLQFSASTGLLRTVRVERPQLKLLHLDLSSQSDLTADATVAKIVRAFNLSILGFFTAVEQEFVEMEGKLFVPRLLTQKSFHRELGRRPAQKDNASPPEKLALDPEATYVLSGGLGGIGRSIADMMVVAGARNINFISRSGARATEAQNLLGSLRERGINAQAYCCDITEQDQVDMFVKDCSARGEKIKGVVQCAMVLRDSMFDNMTFEQWTQATKPKILGSWNLHKCMPQNLDFFIMLSSMAGVIGNPGQANYAAAGTYQDALSRYRRANGFNSMTIDLGIVSDVGYIAENPEQFERLDYLENLFISERDLHLILSAAMLGHTRDGIPVPAQLVTGVGKELLQDGSIGSAMASDLKYVHLHELSGSSNGADGSSDENIKTDLKAAGSAENAFRVVENVLAAQLAKQLMMEKEDVDLEKPMHAYGVDSLAAVEVRNMIFRKMKADISVFDILSSMPLVKLAVKIVSKSQFIRADVATAAMEQLTE